MTGCPKRAVGPGGHLGPEGQCATQLGPDEFVPRDAPPAPNVRSRLGVELVAEIAAVQRELGRQVPVRLAGEKRRPVGAPGDVTYSVTRGPFSLTLDGDRLLCAVPVSVEVEVCKPLGPFCPVYGHCSPRLAAVASVPVLLDESYEMGRSRVGISVLSPCTIAGIDATPEIRRRAAGAVGLVQRRIDAAIPELRPTVAGIWELLHHPVLLGTRTCLRITPERLAQGHPTGAGGRISTRLAAEGTLRVEDPCKDPNAAVSAPPLPKLETRASLPAGIELNVPIHTDFTDVESALARALIESTSTDAPRIVAVEASGTGGGEHGLVALRITVAGSVCGLSWLLAEPWYDATLSRIRLRNVRLATERAAPPALAALIARVESRAAIPLPVDVSAGPAAIDGLIRGFSTGLPESVTLESDVAPARVSAVHVTAEGLVAVATFSGNAAVHVK